MRNSRVKIFLLLVVVSGIALLGCSYTNTAVLPQKPTGFFVTTGSINEPYDSLGFLQVHQVVFGTKLSSIINRMEKEAKAKGADGVINFMAVRANYIIPIFSGGIGEMVKLKK